MKKTIALLCILFLYLNINAESNPKREFRGAWIATVLNIDWPGTKNNTEAQKAELISLLNQLQSVGVNAVMFQIRTECDAFYESPYEPWSAFLTGVSGMRPEPFYDPLDFAVGEAHKRGMELHAWINPYRAKHPNSTHSFHPSHVTLSHPEWILNIGTNNILNPGLPEVRSHILTVISDIVRRYDIDGIHFDDYFYVSGITNQDNAAFAQYPRGFNNIKEWRRDNVNMLVSAVSDSINSIKSYVKFGISPVGMWRSGYPSGICGLYAYDDLYADGMTWLRRGDIDYISPQLYWRIGSSISCGSTAYEYLLNWWSDSLAIHNRHLYPGQAVYRISGWPATEVPQQIRIGRADPNVQGQIFYNTNTLLSNPKNFLDSLGSDLFSDFAIPPVMDWRETIIPEAPQNVRYERIPGEGIAGLIWDMPEIPFSEKQPDRFVIYGFDQPSVNQSDFDDAVNIERLHGAPPYSPVGVNSSRYYYISALDRNNNESLISNMAEIMPPALPDLLQPQNAALNQRDTLDLVWRYAENAAYYILQVSKDPLFSTLLLTKTAYDTVLTLTGLEGQSEYFWRVIAYNPTGNSGFTNPYSFITGFPLPTTLSSPLHATLNMPLNPNLMWNIEISSDSYRVQVGTSNVLADGTIVFDSTGIADTSAYVSVTLDPQRIYYWRVKCFNQYGQSVWSSIWGFKTGDPVSGGIDDNLGMPDEYALSQNYPNPFNPETSINFELPAEGYVTLKIYDLLGREIRTLISGELNAGYHSVRFAGTGLASGVYVYRLNAGNKSFTRKMTIIK